MRTTTTDTTYTDLITTIGCDVLNTCEDDIAELLATTIDLTPNTTAEVAELSIEPVVSAPMEMGPTPAAETTGSQLTELTPVPIEMPTIQAPVITAPIQSFSPEASVETEIQAEISNDIGASIEQPMATSPTESGAGPENSAGPEPETPTETAATEPEPEAAPEPSSSDSEPEAADAQPESNNCLLYTSPSPRDRG